VEERPSPGEGGLRLESLGSGGNGGLWIESLGMCLRLSFFPGNAFTLETIFTKCGCFKDVLTPECSLRDAQGND
jgi:hypothetical protein